MEPAIRLVAGQPTSWRPRRENSRPANVPTRGAYAPTRLRPLRPFWCGGKYIRYFGRSRFAFSCGGVQFLDRKTKTEGKCKTCPYFNGTRKGLLHDILAGKLRLPSRPRSTRLQALVKCHVARTPITFRSHTNGKAVEMFDFWRISIQKP